MCNAFWREAVNWSKDLELRYSCPLQGVTTKGMRCSLQKFTTPKLIKKQLQEIAQNSPSSDSATNSVRGREINRDREIARERERERERES